MGTATERHTERGLGVSRLGWRDRLFAWTLRAGGACRNERIGYPRG